MDDTLILGGGVVGLSLAYELACRAVRVRLVDRQEPGREASWAGAGILPPAKFRTRSSPVEWLQGMSSQLHPEWSERLREETGIDNGYRRSGGVYLAESDADASELMETCDGWRRAGLSVRWLHAADLEAAEPPLAAAYDRCSLRGAAAVAEEAQLRNPRHIKALLAACLKRGVRVTSGVEAYDFDVREGRVAGVRTSAGDLTAGTVVVACGSWSRMLARRLGLDLPIRPIRGQIALLRRERRLISHVINLGSRYLVPRNDGRVLVGSTEEDAGFERRTTAAAIGDLVQMAVRLVPELGTAELERCWSGLRPATPDGLPFLGNAPGLANAYFAAGHFRHGIWLSTGTATLLARLILGEPAGVDLRAFAVDRDSSPIPA